MAKLLPLLLALVGLLGGAGAGYFLKPAPDAHDAATEVDSHTKTDGHDTKHAKADDHGDDPAEPGSTDFVKLNNQFVVPVVDGGRVSALVVMSLSLEVEAGGSAAVYEREPKLRDAFLQVLFDHANAGGFRGSFTETANMAVLRNALRETAQRVMGPTVSDVLIMDMMRQDG